jgi:lysophospholipase L1-like esterase
VVPWADRVASSPGLLAGDGVHGTAEGYQVRASLYAEAIHSCGA